MSMLSSYQTTLLSTLANIILLFCHHYHVTMFRLSRYHNNFSSWNLHTPKLDLICVVTRTVSRDFWPTIFFIKWSLLGPWFIDWSCIAYGFVFDEKIASKNWQNLIPQCQWHCGIQIFCLSSPLNLSFLVIICMWCLLIDFFFAVVSI
jgi:hypothetical protein